MSNKLLISNLQFIQRESGIKWEDFYSIINISESTCTNYKNGSHSPSSATLAAIAEGINKILNNNSTLKTRFPKGILASELTTEDLEALSKKQGLNVHTIYTDKFVGDYMCYYMSTTVDNTDKKPINSGILQLRLGEQPNEFIAYGIFSLKSIEEAHATFDKINDKCLLTEKADEESPSLFIGKAYLSSTLLWCNLSNTEKKEHVSISFDLSEKITTKYPEKTFYGVRGIALSQTSGYSNQTTTFPLVIVKSPLTVSPNELEHYLHFNYSQIAPEELDKLAKKTIDFFNSQYNNTALQEVSDNSLLSNLLAAYVKHELKDLLKRHIFNSHYFTTKEMDVFYKNIIRPMRTDATIKDKID